MKRIAEVTDLHIDITNRFEETVRVLDWIADDIARRGVDLIAIAGDVFERRPTRECSLAAGRFHRRCARTAPVVGVYGNHDPPGCLDDVAHHEDEDEVSIYGALAGAHPIKFYSQPAVHRVDGIQIACLPWPRHGGHVGAAYQEMRQALVDVLRGLGAEMDSLDWPRLFLGHVNIIGAKVSAMSQPLNPGAGIDVGTEDLALVRAHAYLFGHIHLGQTLDIGGAPGIYPGSPKRVNWGESERKYYAILTIEDDGTVVDVEMVETPCRPMLKVEAEYLPGEGLVLEPVGDVVNAEIRLRYKTPAEHLAAARAAAAEMKRGWLASGAYRVDPEPDPMATVHARIPELTTNRDRKLSETLELLRTVRGETLPDVDSQRLAAKVRWLESEAAS